MTGDLHVPTGVKCPNDCGDTLYYGRYAERHGTLGYLCESCEESWSTSDLKEMGAIDTE